jgi:hypothetical protein
MPEISATGKPRSRQNEPLLRTHSPELTPAAGEEHYGCVKMVLALSFADDIADMAK